MVNITIKTLEIVFGFAFLVSWIWGYRIYTGMIKVARQAGEPIYFINLRTLRTGYRPKRWDVYLKAYSALILCTIALAAVIVLDRLVNGP
jgi:hypothetical protein